MSKTPDQERDETIAWLRQRVEDNRRNGNEAAAKDCEEMAELAKRRRGR
jgi:hypothetical protein